MDVEGAEPLVFQGMSKIINSNKKLKIFVEFDPLRIKRAGYEPKQFARKLLEDYRFSILAIVDEDKRALKVRNINEILSVCREGKGANLFLSREEEEVNALAQQLKELVLKQRAKKQGQL
jgi:hypothetical protein